MPEAYIVEAVRTAGGRRGGRLAGVHPVDLAATSVSYTHLTLPTKRIV